MTSPPALRRPACFAFAALVGVACSSHPPPAPRPASTTRPAAAIEGGAGLSADERAAAARVTPTAIAAPTRFLSDGLLEGRAPGSRGGDLAVAYVASEFAAAGLAPGAEGTYVQRVPLVGVRAELPAALSFEGKAGALSLAVPNDLVLFSGVQAANAELPPAELVFVGYGIVAPEYQWDDYKDVDVRGKVVVVMNNDPSRDPALFAGETRLWYGRWDYKYLQAAKKGAAGVILVHTTPSAGYPWQVVVTSNTREKFELPDAGEPRAAAKMWATEDASRKLVALGGADLDALRASAETRAFRPVPLGVRVRPFAWKNAVRKVTSANVLGLLPGSDPVLAREAVIYSAHHDHLGVGLPKNGDAIYNGAVDNASGVGALIAIARAVAAGPRPRRSMLFLAVAAEEQGLRGSEWYCAHPTFPPGRIAADLNMDSMNVLGRTSDVGFVGLGKSSLDEVVAAVARAQGRTLHGDAFPDRGAFYRSDQFSFAKIGVPGVYVHGGPNFVGRPAGWGKEHEEEFERVRYHQPSDEFDPSWDWSGAVQDAQLLLLVGLRVAEAPSLPAWRPDDEFARVPRPR